MRTAHYVGVERRSKESLNRREMQQILNRKFEELETVITKAEKLHNE